MSRLPVLLLASAVCLALALPAAAGITIEMKHVEAGKPEPSRIRTYIGADRARVEADGNIVIWRGDRRLLWVVDEAEGVVRELDEAGVNSVSEMMAGVQAQMAAMPAEQRAMMEAMMNQRMGGASMPAAAPAPRAPLTWTPNGSSDTVAQRPCRGFDGKRDGRLEATVCATDWVAADVKADDFATLEDMAAFLSKLAGPMAGRMDEMRRGLVDSQGPGLPLRTTTKTPKGDDVAELVAFTRSDLAPALFEPPAGMRTEKMMDEMRGGPGGPGDRGQR